MPRGAPKGPGRPPVHYGGIHKLSLTYQTTNRKERKRDLKADRDHRARVRGRRNKLQRQGGMTQAEAIAAEELFLREARQEERDNNPEYRRLENLLQRLGGPGGGHMSESVADSKQQHDYQTLKRATKEFLGYVDERRHRGHTTRPAAADDEAAAESDAASE